MRREKRVPHVVLDTNVVLSSLVFAQGKVANLRLAWQAGRFVPLAARDTAAELVRVLAYPKFKLSAEAQRELLADYLPWCAVVDIPNPPQRTPPCRDPFDIPFLHLAITGKADFLVTGDVDLLALKRVLRCPILPPDQFLAELDSISGM